MNKIILMAFSFVLFLNSVNSQDKKFDYSLNIKKNFQFNLVDVITPLSSNDNIGIQPYVSFGLNDSSILGNLNLYLGFYYQNFSVTGSFKYKDNSVPEMAEGELKFALGYYTPLIGCKYFLSNNNTRPYVNAHYRLYIPNIKTDGELIAEDESYSWNANKDIGKLLKNIIVISNKEIGFGVEHKFNKNLAIFGEYNLQFFTFKVKVKDAEDYIDDLTTAVNNIENGGIDTNIDVEDLQFIEGNANAKIKYMSSYASLGISFYF
ncbi:MAG: hypothetical protein GX292_08525 [Bacteroidales bacterium]|jgi:hypothetical protein|nr:hypothetical protein [Bacteroidales bacterium]